MKLKVIFAATLLAAMTMSSCSSDNPVDATENVARGEATYASFTINLASTGSRAGNDDNADEVEQTISKVSLYIFSGGVLETYHEAEASEINNNKISPVKTTTGEKVIYAIVNDLLVDGEAYTATEETTRLADFEKVVFNSLKSQIAESGNFLMISKPVKAAITKTTEANPFQVKVVVTRAAAKAQVKFVAEDVTVRSTIKATFDNAVFALVQNAEEMNLGWDPYQYTPNAAKQTGAATYDGYTAVPANDSDIDFIDAVTEFSAVYTESDYTAESYNKAPVTGNTTFALVRLKATPSTIYSKAEIDKTTGEIKLTPGSISSTGDFYVVAKNDKATASYVFATDKNYDILYFTSETAAKNYISAAKLDNKTWTFLKYTGGNVYYRVNIMNPDGTDLTSKYSVHRNHYYKIDVTDIKALGANDTPGVTPTDPDTPIETEAWVETEIEVDNWEPVEMDNTTLQ